MRHHVARLVKDGLYKEAIALFAHSHSNSLPPTKFTFPYILKACAKLNAASHGRMLHAHVLKSGLTDKHTTTDLTNMYMKLGLLHSAAKLFDEIPNPGLSILNVLISGLSQNGLFRESFRIFREYSLPNLRLDSVTIASLVSACVNVVNGVQLHCLAVKLGVESSAYSATSLVTMYLNCGELVWAGRLFGLIRNKNMVCYNAYLSGLAQNGVSEMVFCVFNEMLGLWSEKPDVITMISVLSACANGNKCLKFGRQLHGLIMKLQLTFDTKIGTALVDMYSKCGSWQCAYDVFIELGNKRNLVTWNSMIAGLMLHDQCEKAVALFIELESEIVLKADPATWNSMIGGFSQLGKADEAFLFFRKMLSSGIKPNLRCVTSLLSACSSLSAQNYGKQIHAYVARTNTVDDDFLAAAIIDMYMKCGLPSWARTFFDMFDEKPKDPAFWNAMISGYGKHGLIEFAFEIFGQMVREKIKPNSVTFSCLLSACSHVERVNMGFQIFRLMIVEFGVSPSSKHMGILIDLLSRSGKLDEAFELLQGTSENSAAMMASLLGYSELHLDSRIGEEVARRILELEPENPVPFVVLSNIYAGQDRWKDVHRIRELMDEKGLRKVPGLSSVEL
ncbi:pentatricopeptide repeat-containing protein [Striga asiatica]|uniref:Pentatricopeptide repeat-containing protein n=1 Tax=Striga asiatica TaxID=4170 RepID=A0A5A7PHH0_STRAF|nr:pentatricopeptide repeat-containing protein [Striga asiatica]